jgi:hypothetical protein
MMNAKIKPAIVRAIASRYQGLNCNNGFVCNYRCLDTISIAQNTQKFKWRHKDYCLKIGGEIL